MRKEIAIKSTIAVFTAESSRTPKTRLTAQRGDVPGRAPATRPQTPGPCTAACNRAPPGWLGPSRRRRIHVVVADDQVRQRMHAKPSRAVKKQTSTITTKKRLGGSFGDARLRVRAARDSASSRPSRWRWLPHRKAQERRRQSRSSFSKIRRTEAAGYGRPSPRCGRQKSPSNTTTITVGTETRNASPPVCLGPKKFSPPMTTMASRPRTFRVRARPGIGRRRAR